MGKKNFKKYIWMLDTIYRSGGISKKELISRWKRSPLNDTGKTIAQRTFREDIKAIEEIFDVCIGCNASNGYKYFIEDSAELSKGIVKNWLLTSFSINNMMAESKQLNNRILYERIPCGTEYLTTIVQAMKDNVCLTITYQGFRQDSPYTTTVMPYCVKVFKQRWYMIAMPTHIGEIRTYALDRIKEIKLTDEHFNMSEDFDASLFFYNSYGILVEPEEYDIETIHMKVSNERNKCDYLRLLPLHHTQKEIERKKDFSIFEVKLYPSLDFIQEILSNGDEIEVLSPQWVREEIASYIILMQRAYKDAIDIVAKKMEEDSLPK